MQEPDPNEVYGSITAAINSAHAAIKRMEAWRSAPGFHGLAYHQAVSSMHAMETARDYLRLSEGRARHET